MSLRAIALAIPAVLAVGVAVALWDSPDVARIVLIAGFGYGAIVVTATVEGRWPSRPVSPFDVAQRREPTRSTHVAALDRIETSISFSHSRQSDYDYRLRPVLFRGAVARLRARGVSWEHRPEEARRLLGTGVLDMIEPVPIRPGWDDRPGVPLGTIERIVKAIEEV